MKKLKDIKQQVKYILEHNPESRDDDKLLQVLLLKKFYGVRSIDDLLDKKVPSLESITRCRRKWQSEGMFESSKATKQARTEEIEVYKEFAYSTV